jgi:hypothetical protein
MRCAAVALCALVAPTLADAAPCSDLSTQGTVLYAQVGDTQNNLMKRLARALRDNTDKKIVLAWVTSGSCTNIASIYTGVKISEAAKLTYVPSTAEDGAWTPSSTTVYQCDPPAGGVIPDIANSALFNSACNADAPPATVRLTEGPVQAYVLAVPEASSQTAITFEEAFFVFGYGMAGMISPWLNELGYFIRKDTKSTLLAWGANLGIPASKWKGQKLDGSPDVVDGLLGHPAAEEAIGLLGAEVYDGLRSSLNVLAFRAKDQYAAYYPDSTATAHDKLNVRDGHYTVWSPTIWMNTLDGPGGNPVVPDTQYVIDLIAGKTVSPAIDFDMNALVAAVGLVPNCAMRVQRSFEGGPLSLYAPAEDCTCKYESLVETSSCATCTDTCASGVCRNGFCEVR